MRRDALCRVPYECCVVGHCWGDVGRLFEVGALVSGCCNDPTGGVDFGGILVVGLKGVVYDLCFCGCVMMKRSSFCIVGSVVEVVEWVVGSWGVLVVVGSEF